MTVDTKQEIAAAAEREMLSESAWLKRLVARGLRAARDPKVEPVALHRRMSLGGICRHTESAQLVSELQAPVTQGGLLDIEPHALLADGLEDQMHMGVRLVGVQHHRVAMLPMELLPRGILWRKICSTTRGMNV